MPGKLHDARHPLHLTSYLWPSCPSWYLYSAPLSNISSCEGPGVIEMPRACHWLCQCSRGINSVGCDTLQISNSSHRNHVGERSGSALAKPVVRSGAPAKSVAYSGSCAATLGYGMISRRDICRRVSGFVDLGRRLIGRREPREQASELNGYNTAGGNHGTTNIV